MLEDLFIPEDTGSIGSSETELSEDINSWPMEIQSAIVSALPVLADAPGQLVMDAVDHDKLYAKGSYVIDTPDDKMVIPIVIKAKQLSPIDLFIYKDSWYLADPETISAILTSAQIGTGLMAEADIPPTAASGMRTKVNPPGSYGTGTGIVSTLTNKVSSANPKLTEQVVTTIAKTATVMGRLAKNPKARKAFINTLEKPYSEKAARVKNPFIGSDAVVVSLGNGNFNIKSSAKKSLTTSEVRCNGNELATMMKAANVDSKRILNELVTTKMAYSWNDDLDIPVDKMASIAQVGTYKCLKQENGTVVPVNSFVLGSVKTAMSTRYLTINSDGSHSYQDALYGSKLASDNLLKCNALIPKFASAMKIGDSIVVPLPYDTKDSPLAVLPPFRVEKINHQKMASVYEGTSDGCKTAFIVVNDSSEVPVRAKHIPKEILINKMATAWYVPTDYPVYSIPLVKKDLVKSASDMRGSLLLNKAVTGKGEVPVTVRMWKVGSNSVAIKMASAEPKVISDAEAMLYLRKGEGYGVSVAMSKMAAGIIKQFDLIGAVGQDVKVKDKTIDSKSTTKVPDLSKFAAKIKRPSIVSTLKIASLFENEEDINTVLALNYLTPENLAEFKQAVPDMQATEEILAKLLMSTRLGNGVVEESDVKSCLQSLHEIIKEIDSAM
jgi:hypothetical protein